MKKTTTINLNGTLFHIDEDAYERLAGYLDQLRGRLSGDDDVDEIMEDIESRIAELFKERLRYGLQVVTQIDVNEVIAIMGNPEEIESGQSPAGKPVGVVPEATTPETETAAATGSPQPAAPAVEKVEKRLFRDTVRGYIGGVAAGLGCYFSTRPVWFRIAFLLLTCYYGLGVGLYLLFWMLVPEARTTTQRLEMKGEAVTIDNIAKAVKEEVAQEEPDGTGTPQQRSRIQRILSVVLKIVLAAALLVVGGFVGIPLLGVLVGLIVLLFAGLCLGLFLLFSGSGLSLPFFELGPFGNFDFPFSNDISGSALPGVMTSLIENGYQPILALVLLLGIPLYTLLRFTFGRVFHWNPQPKWLNWTLGLFWFGAIILLVYWLSHTSSEVLHYLSTGSC